jgi:hypothetical protein
MIDDWGAEFDKILCRLYHHNFSVLTVPENIFLTMNSLFNSVIGDDQSFGPLMLILRDRREWMGVEPTTARNATRHRF